MTDSFSFETKRLFSNRRHLSVFLIFLALSLYTINLGIEKHKEFEQEKNNFLDYEKQKTEQYVNHEQYGAYGFRVLFVPSPLSIYRSSTSHALIGSIDTKEIVNIFLNLKGKNIFSEKGRILDFAVLLYVFGSLIMLIFGLNQFPSPVAMMKSRGKVPGRRSGQTIRFCDVFARLSLLLLFFSTLLVVSYLFPISRGILFQSGETHNYILFSLFTLCFLSLFFLVGLFLSMALQFKRNLFLVAYAAWFLAIFIAPEINRIHIEKAASYLQSNESVNIKKLKNVMNFERKTKEYFSNLKEKRVKDIEQLARQLARNYSERMYRLNKQIETDLRRTVDRLIHEGGRKASLVPTTYFLFLSQEFLSGGYHGYQEFLSYILELKELFFHYYMDNRYDGLHRRVEGFVQNEENIFAMGNYIPPTFTRGILFTLFYFLIFLGFIYSWVVKNRRTYQIPGAQKEKKNFQVDKMTVGRSYFAIFEDEKERKEILSIFRKMGSVIIHKIHNNDYDTGLTLYTWLRHECLLRDLTPSDILEKLIDLGVEDRYFDTKLKSLPRDILNLTFLAIKISESSRYYLLNDFISGMSRDFELKVKEILKRITDSAAVIYLSDQMFELNLEEKKTEKESRVFILDFDKVSLR